MFSARFLTCSTRTGFGSTRVRCETFCSRADCAMVNLSIGDENVVLDLGHSGRRPGCSNRLVVIRPGADGPAQRDRSVRALDRDAPRVELGVPFHRLLDRVLDVVGTRSRTQQRDEAAWSRAEAGAARDRPTEGRRPGFRASSNRITMLLTCQSPSATATTPKATAVALATVRVTSVDAR